MSEQDTHQQCLFMILFYQNDGFVIPEFGELTMQPFQLQQERKNTAKSIMIENQSNSKPATFTSKYLMQFEHIAGGENLFPIFLELSPTHYYVCCKDCFVGMPIHNPSSYLKVNTPQMPTAFKLSPENNLLYLGLQSGSIIIYNLTTQATLTTFNQFSFPVMQIEIYAGNQIVAMDVYGNIKVLTFSATSFMEKFLKVSVKVEDIVENFRVKKREKIKNLMKGFPFSKNQTEINNANEQNNEKKKNTTSKFALMPKRKRNQHYFNNTQSSWGQQQQQNYENKTKIYPLAYYYKKSIKIFIIESESQRKIKEEILIDSEKPSGEECEIKDENDLGMMEFGEGGFENSNQTHIILVISILNRVVYFREVRVENSFQYLRVYEREEASQIMEGKFCSQNLLIYLTQSGIEISNVNSNFQKIHSFNFKKFSYIEFFNSEQEGFKVEMTQVHKNILKSVILPNNDKNNQNNKNRNKKKGENEGKRSILFEPSIEDFNKQQQECEDGDCVYACLQGKRIITGSIYSWREYLNKMADDLEWQECMNCALLIYLGKHSLLSGIKQNLEHRNQDMKTFFEKIALSYLSYQFKKKGRKGKRNIIKQVINFLVQTQCFIHLFTTIFQLIKSFKMLKAFMQELKESIEGGYIRCMTEQVLDLTINFYLSEDRNALWNVHHENKVQILEKKQQNQTQSENSEKIEQQKQKQKQIYKEQNDDLSSDEQEMTESKKTKNRKHLQTLIMNFDLNIMEKQYLLSICLNYQLYQSLIQICVTQKDFITPVLKLCGLRLTKNQNKAPKDEIDRISDILFWYLKECFLHHMVTFDDDESYLSMLEQLLSFIFIPGSFSILLQVSAERTFQMVNMLFDSKMMPLILENSHRFVLKKCHYFQKYHVFEKQQGQGEGQQQQGGGIEQFQIFEKMIAVMMGTIESSKQRNKVEHFNLNKFLTFLILINSFPFNIQLKLRAYQFLIDNPFSFFSSGSGSGSGSGSEQKIQQKGISLILRILDSILRNYSILQLKNEEVPDAEDSEDAEDAENQREKRKEREMEIEEEKKNILLKMYEKITLLFLEDSDKKATVLLETKCYLLHQLQRPLEVIDTYLKIRNQKIRAKVFEYLNSFLVIEGKMQKSSIFIGFASKMTDLFAVNRDKSLKILQKVILEGRISHLVLEDIVDKFKNNPELQLTVIEIILERIRRQEEESTKEERRGMNEYGNYPNKYSSSVKEKFTMMHLNIAVAHQKNRLEEYIMKIDYPLEEAYKVCEEINNKSAMAFILVKSGRNIDGVVMMTDIFLATVQEGLGKMAKYSDDSLVEKMRSHLKQVLTTCQNQFENDHEKGEEMWQKVAEKLFKGLNIKSIDSIPKQNIKQLLQQFSQQIFTTIFQQVSADFFINKFNRNPKLSINKINLYMLAHRLIFERMCFRFEINSLAKELQKENQMRMSKSLQRSFVEGVRVDSGEQICFICMQAVPYEIQQARPISRISMSVFGCQHAYHSECLLLLDEKERRMKAHRNVEKGKRNQLQEQIEKQIRQCGISSSSSLQQHIQSEKSNPPLSIFCRYCMNQWHPFLVSPLNSNSRAILPSQNTSLSNIFFKREGHERKESTFLELKQKLMEFDELELGREREGGDLRF